jgi:peroxiredoxin
MAEPNATQRGGGILEVGTPAPDFTLQSAPGQTLRLSELRGRPVILAFYPADWSPVCGDQMVLYNEVLPNFREYGAELLGISVDGVWCHAAFARHQKLHFPLLSDFEPKGAVSRLFGAYRESDGTSERALFVLDGEGIIRWSYLSPIDVNPGADGILNALESLAGASSDAEARRPATRARLGNSTEARP